MNPVQQAMQVLQKTTQPVVDRAHQILGNYQRFQKTAYNTVVDPMLPALKPLLKGDIQGYGDAVSQANKLREQQMANPNSDYNMQMVMGAIGGPKKVAPEIDALAEAVRPVGVSRTIATAQDILTGGQKFQKGLLDSGRLAKQEKATQEFIKTLTKGQTGIAAEPPALSQFDLVPNNTAVGEAQRLIRKELPASAKPNVPQAGLYDVGKLINDAGVNPRAKIQEIPLNKISGSDYTELDDALRSGRKLTAKEANDLIGRIEDPIKEGRKITSPISVGQNPDGSFYLLSGNNRITQALVNGQKTIKAASNDFRTGQSFEDYAKSSIINEPGQTVGSQIKRVNPTGIERKTELANRGDTLPGRVAQPPQAKAGLYDMGKVISNYKTEGDFINAVKTKTPEQIFGKERANDMVKFIQSEAKNNKQSGEGVLRSLYRETTQLNKLNQDATKYNTFDDFVKAQGGTMYHGTNASFDKFSLATAGQKDDGILGKGIYLTPDKNMAKTYGKNVKEVATGINNPLVLDGDYTFGAINGGLIKNKLGLPTKATALDVRNELIKRGYDGVIFNEAGGAKQIEVMALHPEKITDISKLKDIYNKSRVAQQPKGVAKGGKK